MVFYSNEFCTSNIRKIAFGEDPDSLQTGLFSENSENLSLNRQFWPSKVQIKTILRLNIREFRNLNLNRQFGLQINKKFSLNTYKMKSFRKQNPYCPAFEAINPVTNKASTFNRINHEEPQKTYKIVVYKKQPSSQILADDQIDEHSRTYAQDLYMSK